MLWDGGVCFNSYDIFKNEKKISKTFPQQISVKVLSDVIVPGVWEEVGREGVLNKIFWPINYR